MGFGNSYICRDKGPEDNVHLWGPGGPSEALSFSGLESLLVYEGVRLSLKEKKRDGRKKT